MVLRNYIYCNSYLNKIDESITKLKDYVGDYEGYFQDHSVGLVLCDLEMANLLQIGLKKYDLRLLKEMKYLADGENRRIEIVDFQGVVVDAFDYEVFWIDEGDMLEIAFGLPDDIERDLLKYVSNKINASKG